MAGFSASTYALCLSAIRSGSAVKGAPCQIEFIEQIGAQGGNPPGQRVHFLWHLNDEAQTEQRGTMDVY